MKDLKDMTIRREFVLRVLDALEELQKETKTNGESALLYQMLKTAKNCLK